MSITQPVKWSEIKNKPTTVSGSGLADAATVTQATNASNPGTVAWYAANTAPNGWIKANGAQVSRSTYVELFNAIGTTYGAGDGSTTFNVPDLRGEFVRSLDDGRGVDSGRSLGTGQTDALQNIVGQFADIISRTAASATGPFQQGTAVTSTGAAGAGNTGYATTFDASRTVRTSTETRPRNVALLACIKF